MPVTYTLGKDAVIDGVPSDNIRNVTATVEGSQIDVTVRGKSRRVWLSGFREASIEIEMLTDPPEPGDILDIKHENSGLEGKFLVVNVSESQPLDDVRVFNVSTSLHRNPNVTPKAPAPATDSTPAPVEPDTTPQE